MANWGRRPITDAGKPLPSVTYLFNGEERIDRRPIGRVERFVDPQGNVCNLQLAGDGDPNKAQRADVNRTQYHRDGFVEHAKCPLRHGLHLHAGVIKKDFSTLPDGLGDPCTADPKVMTKVAGDLVAQESCPHVEWLITSRREKEAAQAKKRNAARIAQEKRDENKRRLEELQLKKAEQEFGLAPTDEEPKTRRKRIEAPE